MAVAAAVDRIGGGFMANFWGLLWPRSIPGTGISHVDAERNASRFTRRLPQSDKKFFLGIHFGPFIGPRDMRGASFFLPFAAATNAAGNAFLNANKAKDGVVTLPSGLQYKVITNGSGTEHPLPDTTCACHYEGRTAQQYPAGKIFDSSYARGAPTSFAPNQVIKGWTEAMQLMVAGDTWLLYIPSELAYGDAGAGGDIAPGDALVFKLELLKLEGAGKPIGTDELKARRRAKKKAALFKRVKADGAADPNELR